MLINQDGLRIIGFIEICKKKKKFFPTKTHKINHMQQFTGGAYERDRIKVDNQKSRIILPIVFRFISCQNIFPMY